ncbi:hypothetical protein C8R44DRAFT_902800 [Mycena epipterygia]|nr:hypothetical protein C8R44DRAFT_902800 [Mycena epipterygia]
MVATGNDHTCHLWCGRSHSVCETPQREMGHPMSNFFAVGWTRWSARSGNGLDEVWYMYPKVQAQIDGVAMLNPQCILHIGPKGMILDEVHPLYPKVQAWMDGIAYGEPMYGGYILISTATWYPSYKQISHAYPFAPSCKPIHALQAITDHAKACKGFHIHLFAAHYMQKCMQHPNLFGPCDVIPWVIPHQKREAQIGNMGSCALPIPILHKRARDALTAFDHTAYDILTQYLCNCATLEYEPYEFDATCRMMVERFPVPSTPQLELKLRTSFSNIIHDHPHELEAHPECYHIDHIVSMIMNLLPESFDAEFASHLVLYLACRPTPSEALYRGLGRCNPKFIGSLLTTYVASNPRDLIYSTLTQIFWLAVDRSPCLLVHFDEETLIAVSGAPHFFFTSCAAAVLKTRILMAGAELASDQLDALMDRLQIPASTSMGPTARWKEGFFPMLIDFLEQTDEQSMSDDCNQQWAVLTFNFLVACRFATWFLKTANGPAVTVHSKLMNAIIVWENRALLESLDDHVARKTICVAVNTYLVTLSGEQGGSNLKNRILQLLVLLDPLPSDNITIVPTTLTAPITRRPYPT